MVVCGTDLKIGKKIILVKQYALYANTKTEKAETCKSCSYQLNKPSHEQISNIEESEKNSLIDQLMDEWMLRKKMK